MFRNLDFSLLVCLENLSAIFAAIIVEARLSWLVILNFSLSEKSAVVR